MVENGAQLVQSHGHSFEHLATLDLSLGTRVKCGFESFFLIMVCFVYCRKYHNLDTKKSLPFANFFTFELQLLALEENDEYCFRLHVVLNSTEKSL